MIQDRVFNEDGSLLYPVIDTGGDPDPRVPQVWIPEFFGDTVLVNGKVWPFLEVEPRKYRLRMLNASNARWYHLTLNEADPMVRLTGRPGPELQHHRHGRRVPAGVPSGPRDPDRPRRALRRHRRLLRRGRQELPALQQPDAKAPFPDGDDVVPANVMLFKVTKRLSGRDTSSIPSRPAAQGSRSTRGRRSRPVT